MDILQCTDNEYIHQSCRWCVFTKLCGHNEDVTLYFMNYFYHFSCYAMHSHNIMAAAMVHKNQRSTDISAWPIFGFYRYIGIGQNGQFYRPQ